MRKSCFYVGALVVLFASCSNEDDLIPQVSPGQPGDDVVNELKISLVSGTGPGTRTASGGGIEDILYNAFVFVKADVNRPDAASQTYDCKHIVVELTQGQTSTVVKHVEGGSKAYVPVNTDYLTKAGAGGPADDVNGSTANFHDFVEAIGKSYVSKLETATGRFIMSGAAAVPALNNTGTTVLAVSLKGDLAKVNFKVNRASTEANLRIKTVEEVTVHRSADHIKSFAMDGTALTTYVLPYGFGDANYVQDGLKGDVFTPGNDQQAANVTDFSFIYRDKDVMTFANDFTFNNFHVLSNAANTTEKSTIIVLKARIEKQKADDTDVWEEIQDSKYYKARISSGLIAYNTARNSSYTITATIKGEGNDKPSGPDPDSLDAENTENDLNINVQVESWSLVAGSQEIG